MSLELRTFLLTYSRMLEIIMHLLSIMNKERLCVGPSPFDDMWLSEGKHREKRVEVEHMQVRENQRWLKKNKEIEQLKHHHLRLALHCPINQVCP